MCIKQNVSLTWQFRQPFPKNLPVRGSKANFTEASGGLPCSEADPAFCERRIYAVEPLLTVNKTPDVMTTNLEPHIEPMPKYDLGFADHQVVGDKISIVNKG
jgi:hypothetical protein